MDIFIKSSFENKKGTWSFVTTENEEILFEDWNNEKYTSSNRIEMIALEKALLYSVCFPEKQVRLMTNSQYCSNGYNIWIRKWKNSNWKSSEGKSISNKDLWEKIDKLRAPNIEVIWENGKVNNKWFDYLKTIVKE